MFFCPTDGTHGSATVHPIIAARTPKGKNLPTLIPFVLPRYFLKVVVLESVTSIQVLLAQFDNPRHNIFAWDKTLRGLEDLQNGFGEVHKFIASRARRSNSCHQGCTCLPRNFRRSLRYRGSRSMRSGYRRACDPGSNCTTICS